MMGLLMVRKHPAKEHVCFASVLKIQGMVALVRHETHFKPSGTHVECVKHVFLAGFSLTTSVLVSVLSITVSRWCTFFSDANMALKVSFHSGCTILLDLSALPFFGFDNFTMTCPFLTCFALFRSPPIPAPAWPSFPCRRDGGRRGGGGRRHGAL